MSFLQNDGLSHSEIFGSRVICTAENGTQGKVICRFVVGKDGQVRDVTIARSLDPYCDKEAIRVIKSMPKWIPGKQNGKAVAVNFTVPIVFKLQ